MTKNVEVGGKVSSGVCIVLEGTNTREAVCEQGDIHTFTSQRMPTEPEQLFKQLSKRILDAADKGHNWAVIGVPGVVDNKTIGLTNVKGMKNQRFNFKQRLAAADPATQCLITDQGFAIYAENDATLAAHAAINRIAEAKGRKRVAALVVGNGIGAGIVEQNWGVYRSDGLPYEIGHLPVQNGLVKTYETMFSSPSIKERFRRSPEELSAGHSAWVEVGQAVGSMALTLGLVSKADLVVPTGEIGGGAHEKFFPALKTYTSYNQEFGSDPQVLLMPEIVSIGNEDPQTFDMHGATGVVIAREVDQNMPLPPPVLNWTRRS